MNRPYDWKTADAEAYRQWRYAVCDEYSGGTTRLVFNSHSCSAVQFWQMRYEVLRALAHV